MAACRQPNGQSYSPDVEAIRAELVSGHMVVLTIQPTVMHQYGEKEDPWEKLADWNAGAHGIVVTGIDANGNLVVSSWGQQYYIEANEFGKYGQPNGYIGKDKDGNPISKTVTGYASYEVFK
jgi:hypothetical protein